MRNNNDEVTLQKIVDIFAPHIWILAIVSIVFAGVLGFYSAFLIDDTYTSTGKYMVVKTPYTNATSETTGLNTNEVEAMQSMIANVSEIINTYDFCQSIIDKLGRDDITHKQLMSMMSIKLTSKETTCYFLNVKSADKQLAFEVADAAGELICDHFDAMGYAIKITEIDNPRPAISPDSKNVIRNSVIGFAVGLIGCALVIFIRFRFDVVISNKDGLESYFDYPILGLIPRAPRDNTNGGI